MNNNNNQNGELTLLETGAEGEEPHRQRWEGPSVSACSNCFSFGQEESSSTNINAAGPIDPVSAKELYELSSDERNRLYEEIHGVLDIPQEDPDMVNYALQRMEEEIQLVTKRGEYRKALFINPSMVRSSSFRLMFLRYSKFDPCVAANKIVQHFHHKSELWGEDKVAKKITLDDLDKDDQESLLSGCRQILPNKDRSGRTVIFHDSKHLVCKTWKNEIKALWYILSLALEDEATQILGAVHVSYQVACDQGMKTKRKPFTGFLLNAYRIRDGLPIRSCATHFCYDSTTTWSAVMLLRTVAGKRFRLRFRDHFGSHLECQYALEGYGIHDLPVDESGRQRKDMILNFIDTRKLIEAEEELEQTILQKIVTPLQCDILVGRGKPFQSHPGNSRLLQLERDKYEVHAKGTAAQRTAICKDVLRIVQEECGGRFLRQEKGTGMWIILDDVTAMDKISLGLQRVKSKSTWAVVGTGGGGRRDENNSDRYDKRARLLGAFPDSSNINVM